MMTKEQALVRAAHDAQEKTEVAIYYRKSADNWYVWWKAKRMKDKDVTEWLIIKPTQQGV